MPDGTILKYVKILKVSQTATINRLVYGASRTVTHCALHTLKADTHVSREL